MHPEQILIGGTTAAICLAGLWKQAWLLAETTKGRKLVEWCGPVNAVWLLRLLLAFGLGFGVLLAAGIVNPIRYPAVTTGPQRSIDL